jgi:hypothetical protein
MATTEQDARPTAQPAMQELLDLAEKTRPDINRCDLEGALLACGTAGWTWSRTLVAAAQILAHGETPHDLRAATRDPLRLRRTPR